jgi:ribose transport system ATP-binding protein
MEISNGHPDALTMLEITKSYPGVEALRKVSFSVKESEIHSLVGENGAGKSTLMRIAAGEVQPDEGQIHFKGKKVVIRQPSDSQRLGVGFIHQELNLIPELSIVENIFLGHLIVNDFGILDWGLMKKRAHELFDQLGVEISPSARVSSLGMAQRQLVEIAKALSLEATFLIMDEPTSALSIEEINRLFVIIQRLRNAGVAVVFITHHLKEIFDIADRVSVLRDGVLVGVRDVAELKESELVQMMIGHSLNRPEIHTVQKEKVTVLNVDDLNANSKLKHITFSLYSQEILGIAGLMGSGRTELLRAIFGIDQIQSGSIKMNGRKIHIRSPKDAIRLGIGLAPEDRKNQGLVSMLSLTVNITFPFVQRFLSILGIDFKEEKKTVEYLVKELSIKTPSLSQTVDNLSGGNKQKVVLAKWLGCHTQVYLLDEPTQGIDVGAKEMIFEIVEKLAAAGSAIIVISSDIEELTRVSDRIIVLYKGGIYGEFQRKDFDVENIMLCAMGKQQ